MDLLSFQTNEEFNEITLYLENNGKSFNNYWTSGNQLGSDMWMWMTTGHPFNVTFNYWAQGGPPLTKSAKGCMEVQSSVWSASNCMDNNAFICQLTRCYYFDYAVTNRINSSQGKTSKESSIGEGNKRLTKLNKDERTVVTLSSENHKQNQGFKPFRNPVKPLQQQNFNPSTEHSKPAKPTTPLPKSRKPGENSSP
ncbi:hypothetical protein Anas_04478 [Armadillidium nasatum]|uniref:C-type lectin domain-containing protein n=1 Tax=Armadillidium nasatum TaxID=96803 RepID=A0A5N5TGT0_9CRUS|nr:hypothetical protein Anas_04478 [Armadillidium nasatum]